MDSEGSWEGRPYLTSSCESEIGGRSDLSDIPENDFEADPSASSSRSSSAAGPTIQRIVSTYQRSSTSDSSDSSDDFVVPRVTLFSILYPEGKCPSAEDFDVVVGKWVFQYKAERTSDRNDALVQLKELFLHVSGCSGNLDIGSLPPGELLGCMQSKFTSKKYPLSETGPKVKKFNASLGVFVKTLVEKCKQSIVFDSQLMTNIISFLTAMSLDTVQAFRHTGTVLALKFATEIAGVIEQSAIVLERARKHYSTERRRARNVNRLTLLQTNCGDFEADLEEVREMLTLIFERIVAQRYCDVMTVIRIACMREMEIWMKSYRAIFDRYDVFRYIGLTLTDKQSSCRLTCLRVLQTVYKSASLPLLGPGKVESSLLDDFSENIKKIVVKLTMDTKNVAIEAIGLLQIMQGYGESISSVDTNDILKFHLYKHNREIAKEIAKLLNDRLQRSTKRASSLSIHPCNIAILHKVVQLCMHCEFQKTAEGLELFVDCVMGSIAEITDWSSMCNLLLDECELNVADCLVKLMASSAKQATTGLPPKCYKPKRLTEKELQRAIEEKVRYSETLCKFLPRLLGKYASENSVEVCIIGLIGHMDLRIYTINRQPECLKSLIHQIHIIIFNQHIPQAIEACAKVIADLCHPVSPVHVTCAIMVEKQFELLSAGVSRASAGYKGGESDYKEELERHLEKLDIVYRYYNLGLLGLWPTLLNLTGYFLERLNSNAIVKFSVGCCNSLLLWSLSTLDDSTTLRQRLLQMLDEFLELCHQLMSCGIEEIEREVFRKVIGLLQAFSVDGDSISLVGRLRTCGLAELEDALCSFLGRRIFNTRESHQGSLENVHLQNIPFVKWFANLLVKGVVKTSMASVLFVRLLENPEHEKVIRNTYEKLAEMDRISCARAVMASLTLSFSKAFNHHGSRKSLQMSNEYNSTKSLSRALKNLLGSQVYKNNDAVVAMHRDGIQYATKPMVDPLDPLGVPPKFFEFFEILCYFTSKLTPGSKNDILEILDQRLPIRNPSELAVEISWQPYCEYRKSLSLGLNDSIPRRTFSDYSLESGDESPENDMLVLRRSSTSRRPSRRATRPRRGIARGSTTNVGGRAGPNKRPRIVDSSSSSDDSSPYDVAEKLSVSPKRKHPEALNVGMQKKIKCSAVATKRRI